MSINSSFRWVPCESRLPEGVADEVSCLVTCREWDIFTGQWGKKEVRILPFLTKTKEWNTKSNLMIEAWMYSPLPYNGE